MTNSNHSNILIVGGGCAGIAVATRLHTLKSDLSISIIEPSDKSLYQAAWTLVGAGAYDKNKVVFVMCKSGMRSSKVAQILDLRGYKTYNVVNGFICSEDVEPSCWKTSGLPVL